MLNSRALRVIEDGAAGLPLSLDLPDTLPFDDWVSVGRRLCQGQHAINWHIGDWWAFGDHRYGERAKVAAERIFGYEFQSLADMASVSRAFETSRRREQVSFTHHREVASLPAEEADAILSRVVRDGLSTRDVRREVQAIKAANDAPIGSVTAPDPVERKPRPEWLDVDLLESYGRYVEAMEALQVYRELTRREADFYAFTLERLGEAHAERRPVPDEFKVVFREQGRIACETYFNASRITINRWLLQSGKQALIDERARFVKQQRTKAHEATERHEEAGHAADTYLPVATMAADFLRTNRYGGWRICRHGGEWIVGTVQRTSEELIVMAERQGFDREAAVTEARQEGY
jgi:hypothetical protein